ncbi:retrovirus-related pol polyprotein from transposon TNT 1-94, partial [Tanacetum coccineum]
MSKIGMNMLASKGNVPDVRKVDIYFCKPGGLGKQKNLSFIMLVKTRKLHRLEQTLKDVRYIPGLKRRLISVRQLDEKGYHVGFEDHQWKVTKDSLVVAHGNKHGSLYMVERLGDMSRIGEHVSFQRQRFRCTEGRYGSFLYKRQGNCRGKSKFIQKAVTLHLLHQSEDPATMILLSKTVAGVAVETPLQFGVAERLSRTFRAESTGLRAEAPKMLWADSVSTPYLIYCIPYFPIGLRIPKEEWRGKDTSLAHLKVFGYDSFVNVKDVCREAIKCTFIGNSSDEMRYSFQDTKSHQIIRSRDITFVDSIYEARSATNSSSLTNPIQKSQVVLVDIPENLAKNNNIVVEHGLSSEITQRPGSDMAEFNKPKWQLPLVFEMTDRCSKKA